MSAPGLCSSTKPLAPMALPNICLPHQLGFTTSQEGKPALQCSSIIAQKSKRDYSLQPSASQHHSTTAPRHNIHSSTTSRRHKSTTTLHRSSTALLHSMEAKFCIPYSTHRPRELNYYYFYCGTSTRGTHLPMQDD